MPFYDYSCTVDSAHRKNNVVFSIWDYDTETLKDKPCQEMLSANGMETPCPGIYEHTFENLRLGHSFKGDGWTPRFHR